MSLSNHSMLNAFLTHHKLLESPQKRCDCYLGMLYTLSCHSSMLYRIAQFGVTLSKNSNNKDNIIQNFKLIVENGEELIGILDTVKTLKPNKLYLVNQNFKVGTSGTLIIKPGTQVIFYPGKTIPVNGNLIAEGKLDSLIYFTGWSYQNQNAYSIFQFANRTHLSFCKFKNIQSPLSGPVSAYNCIFETYGIGSIDTLMNCISNNSGIAPLNSSKYLYRNNIINPSTTSPDHPFLQIISNNFNVLKYNNFINLGIPDGATNDNSKLQNVWISESSKNWKYKSNFFIREVVKYQTNYSYTSDYQSIQFQYWGTSDIKKIEESIIDFKEISTRPMARYAPFLNTPPDSCHAIVWKVLVNGKDAQDEELDPVGVGKQRFDVYFNRPMDKTVAPQVAFGVRYPFSSNVVNEEGSWSDDGRIYTVYKTIKLTSGDGINRIRVTRAKDLENWEIPTEDMRFEFLINAANSASIDFQATPSLGKVKLEWNNNDLADGLGYNMYRMEQVNETTLSKPIMVNKTLITDTLYTDFAVTPNKKYYYYYKILRTNLSETDSSKVVSAIPYTASKGDANGDLSVNVLDITTIVAFLLNNNPQPFITEAADLNSDGNINVLDIVGVVNKVLGNTKSAELIANQQISLYLKSDTLFADAPVAIGGIQFDISGVSAVEDIQRLKTLEGFESGYSISDNGLRLIFYSLSGKTIAAGKQIPLLKLQKGSGISSAIFGDKTGSSIPVNYLATEVWNLSENLGNQVAELGQNFPNPLTQSTIIPVTIYEPVDEAIVRIVNVMGQEVDVIRLSHPATGEHLLNWNSGANKGLLAYLLEIRRGTQQFVCPVKKMVVQ